MYVLINVWIGSARKKKIRLRTAYQNFCAQPNFSAHSPIFLRTAYLIFCAQPNFLGTAYLILPIIKIFLGPSAIIPIFLGP